MANRSSTHGHTWRWLLRSAGFAALFACGGSAENAADGAAELEPTLTQAGAAPLEKASADALATTPGASELVANATPTDAAPIPSIDLPPQGPSQTDPATEQPPATECPYPNFPSTAWTPGEWVPYRADSLEELLQAVRATMVGRWHGIASTPWTTPYEVDFSFAADGSYSSRCSTLPGCCVALYYGTDDDTPIKQWRVKDATLSGNVFGEIDVAFDYFEDGYGLPAWQGQLTHIERDASGDGLRFEFQTNTGYGPVTYELRRDE